MQIVSVMPCKQGEIAPNRTHYFYMVSCASNWRRFQAMFLKCFENIHKLVQIVNPSIQNENVGQVLRPSFLTASHLVYIEAEISCSA